MYTGISSQPVRYVNLGSGEMNISNNTLALMKEAIIQASKSPIVRDWATHIIQGVTAKDELGEAGAIYYFVQQTRPLRQGPDGNGDAAVARGRVRRVAERAGSLPRLR